MIKRILYGMNPIAFWVFAWIDLAGSLVTIVSFGFLDTCWSEEWAGKRLRGRGKIWNEGKEPWNWPYR